MKKRTVRIICAVIAGLLVFTFLFTFITDIVANTPGAQAADTVDALNGKLAELAKDKEEIKKEISEIEKKKDSASAKKAALDEQIDVTQQEIDVLNQLIEVLDANILEKEAELEAAIELEAEQMENFLVRVRVMEEEGSISMLGIILSADSFTDMLTRIELVSDIVEGDKNLMKELAETRAKINADKLALDEDRAEQEKNRAELEGKRASLKQQYSDANSLIKELSADAKEYEKKYNEAEAAQEETKEEIKKILEEQERKRKEEEERKRKEAEAKKKKEEEERKKKESSDSKKGQTSSTYTGGTFRWPTKATYITSYYGRRSDPITKKSAFHTGIDIGTSLGSEIYAANSGTVIVAGWSQKGYGNYVVIDHGGGKATLYAHMHKIKTTKGAEVQKGDVIGLVGSTGYSTGPHLHFEILINGEHTNPMNYFNKA
ncbi:MAG: peptidoglycan DD-metalloendopeptidase family protein [Oscillospiraceae bacterium]|nr:peptidoglycan DD-metalloendopeptidase family protein [Oscillospiraceae bacterium]